jgi:hypothetical protein
MVESEQINETIKKIGLRGAPPQALSQKRFPEAGDSARSFGGSDGLQRKRKDAGADYLSAEPERGVVKAGPDQPNYFGVNGAGTSSFLVLRTTGRSRH